MIIRPISSVSLVSEENIFINILEVQVTAISTTPAIIPSLTCSSLRSRAERAPRERKQNDFFPFPCRNGTSKFDLKESVFLRDLSISTENFYSWVLVLIHGKETLLSFLNLIQKLGSVFWLLKELFSLCFQPNLGEHYSKMPLKISLPCSL